MKRPIAWMAGNHVAANLLMMIFIVGGLVMASAIKQEVFPEFDLDLVQITVAYPGAGPEEVEDGIILKIEENISSLTGIKEIRSIAAEGFGRVTAKILPGEDVDLILQDIKAEVDRITTFPEEAEKPIITKAVNRREVISVVVYGNAPEKSIREQAEDIRDELLAMPEITQVDLRGVRPFEISIEIPENTLRKYGLTLNGVAEKIRKASVDLPGGVVKSKGGMILLRTKAKRYTGSEYADITIIENPDGTGIKLGDIATIKDAFRETDQYSRFDGLPAAMISVYRVGNQKPLDISKIVKQYVEEKSKTMPDSLKIATWNDFSEIYRSRMNLLLKNAFLGLILIFIVLGLFLQIRLALWVMLGIPVSFLGALFMMPALDVSINMLSLFAFILALGIVVDDAIVVGENIFTHRSMNKPYLRAAIDGCIEVGTPVVFSVLTTVAAFLPLIFVSGTIGKFIKVIPFVVIPILLVSLVESLFVLPSHLTMGRAINFSGGIIGFTEKIRKSFSGRLERFINGPYERFLTACIHNRYTTIAVSVLFLFVVTGLVGGGVVKFRFMPNVDADFITVDIEMPVGTHIDATEEAHDYIIQKAYEVIGDIDNKTTGEGSIMRHIFSMVGSSIVIGHVGDSVVSGTNLSEIIMMLTQSEKRDIKSAEVARKWREAIGTVPGAESVVLKYDLVRFGENINIQLEHEDFNVLADASSRIKKILATYNGVTDIDDNYSKGKKELKLTLKPEARLLGLSEEDLGRQVRAAFFGAEALRIQRGRNEVKIMVRYPEEDRKSPGDLKTLRIRTRDGREIPFARAAEVTEGRGFTEINRMNRKRIINVTANVDNNIANAEEILAELKSSTLRKLLSDYPGLTYNLEGEEKERMESMGSMISGFMLALFLIYSLLATPFRSYLQPFIIMSAIPFGIVGAILGHLIMGFNLSILSMFGIVALTGVVVNDSLLLISFINEKRRQGEEIFTAVIKSAKRRFRPIILTSLTTSLGLTPIILEKSMQAQFLIPMAISLGFGIIFSTLITLLMIPSLYVILEDIIAVIRGTRNNIYQGS